MTIPEGYCDWCVGDKIVCIDGTPSGYRFFDHEIFPTRGSVYTIREIAINNKGRVGVLLVEIVNPRYPYYDGFRELHFLVSRFRRVQPSQKSIEQLRKLIIKPDPSLIEPVHEDAH